MQEEKIATEAADAAQDKLETCSAPKETGENSGGNKEATIEADSQIKKATTGADSQIEIATTGAGSQIKKTAELESQIEKTEALMRALSDTDVRERLIFGNEEICNEIISRYLDELSYPKSVPLVRGFSALSPLPRPKSLSEAKAIVDKGKIK